MRPAAALVAAGVAAITVAGCSGTTSAPVTVTAPPTTVTATATVTATVTATPAAPPSSSTPAQATLYYPSGDPVLMGYPVIVTTANLDDRLANWIKTPKAVAMAPGVYAGYNPAVTDLAIYLDGPADGDCAVLKQYFPGTGGACWDGVLPGPEEP